ncbi:MAG: DcaP family trimeric outer membrane transporter [Rikenellaceae bacterium]
MKKILISLFAFTALSTSAFAQSSPFEWQVSDNTKIKMGGYIRTLVSSDINSSLSGASNFQPYAITDADWSDENYLNFDVTASRLSMEITQSTDAVGDVKVFVEADFCGTGSTARLRQAYIELKGVVAGYAWSFMSDLAASAPTLDITGVNSRTFLRTQMVGYRHTLSDNLSAGIALEVPSLKTGLAAEYTSLNQTMPNVPFYVQYKTKAGHIKAAGAIRSLQYGDTSAEERLSNIGWGAQLSGAYAVTKGIKIFGQAIYGQGINNYINDLSSLSINMMSTDGTTMEATPMGGASFGFSAKVAPKWTLSASGSYVENFGDEDYFVGSYQMGSYVSANIIYVPAPRISIGAELVNGSRTDFGSDAISAQRASLMIKYTL